MKKRYKIRKEQLERVVESFVMESAAPEAKKHVKGEAGGKMIEKRTNTSDPAKKDWGVNDEPSQAPEAKKHVKKKEGGGKMVEKRSNTKSPKTTMNSKMKHAPEANKHVKGTVSESTELTEEELNAFFNEGADLNEEGLTEADIFGLKKKKLTRDFNKYATAWSRKGAIEAPTEEDFNAFMEQAKADKYGGRIKIKDKRMVYVPSTAKETAGSGLGGPAHFGGR